MEHPDFETRLMNQLKNDRVKNYFNRIDKKNRADALVNYTSLFVPMVKSYKQSRLDLFSKFLKEYTSFKNSTKISFGNILTKNATRYECWDMWKSQLVSSDMERMVKLVHEFLEGFGIVTCLWKINDIRDIARLSKFLNRHIESGDLLAMLSVNQTYKEALQVILTETKTPSRSSYRRILKVLKPISDTEDFYDFLTAVDLHRGPTYEQLWMAMKQFFEYSEDQQKNYIETNFGDSNSSLAQFFKTIQPSSVDDLDVTLMKTWEQWTTHQMFGLIDLAWKSHVMKRFYPENEKNKQTIEMVERVLDENVSYKDCEHFWDIGKDDDRARLLKELIVILDDTFGKMSCETKPPLPSPDNMHLPL
ncbi:hypothetical protein CAEBREN_04036 [Caenorhabditis brenneri]|uniref:Uncharacterized protein n=1 Tax=Caenorhabditis brenneri TaxID=135651 RepID=G0PDN6_CAEBE|nr:hypothetical protein CAEBREN_04036 [Caenorhabditis brenneri]